MKSDPFNARRKFQIDSGRQGELYSLPALEEAGMGQVSRLPVSLRVVLESLLRNCDGVRVMPDHVRALAGWKPREERTAEIPFVVSRILTPDSSGAPLLADLAAMRDVAKKVGQDPRKVGPLVPLDLIIDHSVQVDSFGTSDALQQNMTLEFERNAERYEFFKWAAQAFDNLRVIPPGNGICHQINLEYLARGVWEKQGIYYPDTLIGADSHTPMINGIGVVAWGAGGIEATAGMLGQPIYFLMPDVVGVELIGRLQPGVTSTDMVLTVVEALRKANVVGRFVEYFGDGTASLTVPDRATISNMSPEYGATIGYFPVDEQTLRYFENTGRGEQVPLIEAYFRAQGMFGTPKRGDCDYTDVVQIDLSQIRPSIAGPRRPQDRIELANVDTQMAKLLSAPTSAGGYGVKEDQIGAKAAGTSKAGDKFEVAHGDVLLAAITSCTNTSNPGVLITAGLLARNAVARGMKIRPWIKTSFGPGSRVVTDYLEAAGLQKYLDQLGFQAVGYGCTTCIGNSGPLDPAIEEAVVANDLIASAVLSGNRNFEARIHQNLKANFIMSPPLVIAFALAGSVLKDVAKEPIGMSADNEPVYLSDIWPDQQEVADYMRYAVDDERFRRLYANFSSSGGRWEAVENPEGPRFEWDSSSTYFQVPPFFDGFELRPEGFSQISGARVLGIFGDSITTDHISPGGSIKATSPAGEYLQRSGVSVPDFNSYIARRTNHHVMMRGAFANIRIKNLLVPGTEGSAAIHQPSGEQLSIYDAAMRYQAEGVPLIVIGGEDYGTGSSRDWAAKGTQLLGVRAVVARSFERIHRGNLVGMGVLPIQFMPGDSAQSLGIDGTETLDILGIGEQVVPLQDATLRIHRKDKSVQDVPVRVRVDSPIEVQYLDHGGIMPFVLRDILAA